MKDFITNNYLIVIAVAIFLIFALIGYIVDSSRNKKLNKDALNSPEPDTNEVPKTEEVPKVEEVPIVEEQATVKEEITEVPKVENTEVPQVEDNKE